MQTLKDLINDSKEYALETLHNIIVAYACNISDDAPEADRLEHIAFFTTIISCHKRKQGVIIYLLTLFRHSVYTALEPVKN